MIAELLRLAQQTSKPKTSNFMPNPGPGERDPDKPTTAEAQYCIARKKKNKLSKLSRRKNR